MHGSTNVGCQHLPYSYGCSDHYSRTSRNTCNFYGFQGPQRLSRTFNGLEIWWENCTDLTLTWKRALNLTSFTSSSCGTCLEHWCKLSGCPSWSADTDDSWIMIFQKKLSQRLSYRELSASGIMGAMPHIRWTDFTMIRMYVIVVGWLVG